MLSHPFRKKRGMDGAPGYGGRLSGRRVRWRGCSWRRRRQNGPVLRAQIGYELGRLFVGDRVSEWRHFLAAVQNLIRDSLQRPLLVFVNVGKRWTFFGAREVVSMAVRASLAAEEDRPGLFGSLVLVGGKAARGQGSKENSQCGAGGEGL